MKQKIPGTLIHFFGFHLFYYAIGVSAYLWFIARFSTEVAGNPLQLSLAWALPIGAIVYLPVTIFLYRLSGDKPLAPIRIAKYTTGWLVCSMLTGICTAGYIGLSFVAADPVAIEVAQPEVDTFAAHTHTIYHTSSGDRFEVAAGDGKKSLLVFKSRLGYYYWADRKF